jgi:hypothetical protein
MRVCVFGLFLVLCDSTRPRLEQDVPKLIPGKRDRYLVITGAVAFCCLGRWG